MATTDTLSPHRVQLLRVEAARYALLRRLSFAMRHQMVVHLQPIGLLGEVLERRLAAPAPNLAQVHEGMAKIHGLSKSAAQSIMDVIGWLAPDPKITVPLEAAVQEVVQLLRSHLSFRGIGLQEDAAAGTDTVVRASARHVLPACLLAVADAATAPATLTLRAEPPGDEGSVLTIAVGPGDGTPGLAAAPSYRPLGWEEVALLARAEGVDVTREGAGVRIVFPPA